MSFLNLLLHPAAELQLQDVQEAPDRSPLTKHPCHLLHAKYQLSTLSSYPKTLNVTSSTANTTTGAGNAQHTYTYWFFSNFLSGRPHARPGSNRRDAIGHKQRHTNMVDIEMLEVPTSEREDHLLRDVPQRR